MSELYKYEHTYVNYDLNQEGDIFKYKLLNNNLNSIYTKLNYLHKIFIKLLFNNLYLKISPS
jgi:hypothetical protein